MKFLLMWSFLVGSQWVTGTAYFNDLSICLEVKKTLLEYKSTGAKSYVECRLVESDKDATELANYMIKKKIDYQLGKP
jgi:hypothetical protein